MAANPEYPVPGAVAADRPSEPGTGLAVKGWEEEGGHFPSLPGAVIVPSDVSQPVPDRSAQGDGLAAMRSKFLADYADESIARHRGPRRPRSGPPSDRR